MQQKGRETHGSAKNQKGRNSFKVSIPEKTIGVKPLKVAGLKPPR